jgi:hypothetical protein
MCPGGSARGSSRYLVRPRLRIAYGELRCQHASFAVALPIMFPNRTDAQGKGLRKRTSGSCKGRKPRQPSAPMLHPQGKRRPAAMRRRSKMKNHQPLSAREWPLGCPKQARLPLYCQQRLRSRSRSSGCTCLASPCRLNERSGNVCLSGAADRRTGACAVRNLSAIRGVCPCARCLFSPLSSKRTGRPGLPFAAAPAHGDCVDGAGRESDLSHRREARSPPEGGLFTWRCVLRQSSRGICRDVPPRLRLLWP